ncbi:MAG: adenosylcobinamide-GDP ribazoletransferase, partial [Cyanobacteria bacterium P01_H01_bin.130]
MKLGLRRWIGRWVAAWLFYTAVPLPPQWPVTFQAIARLAPAIGVMIGGGLGVLDGGRAEVGLPIWPRMAVLVAAW